MKPAVDGGHGWTVASLGPHHDRPAAATGCPGRWRCRVVAALASWREARVVCRFLAPRSVINAVAPGAA
jgi:hypothetical protein